MLCSDFPFATLSLARGGLGVAAARRGFCRGKGDLETHVVWVYVYMVHSQLRM